MSEKETNLDELNDIDNLLDDDLEEGDGITTIKELKKRRVKLTKLNKILIGLLIFGIIIFGIVYSVFYYFKMTLSNSRSEFGDMYLKYANKYVLSRFISLKILENKVFDNNNKNIFKRAENMNNYVIDPGIIFYKKKDEKNKFLTKSLNNLTKKISDIDNLKQDIVKYKYINKDLTKIVKDIKIMPILITLNAIKLYFTDYVFIKIKTFDSNILNDTIQSKIGSDSSLKDFISLYGNIFKSYVKEDIKKFGEEGVKIYLTNITFNYMYNDDENGGINIGSSVFINKFKNRFQKELKYRYRKIIAYEPNIDEVEFERDYINLIAGIYGKTKTFLDNTDINLLPINIQLLSYDAKNETLSFSIKLLLGTDVIKNTNGKVTVISLATDVISLLRESRLIIGKKISADKMKVSKKTIRIGGKKIFQNTITLNFNTSVQSEVNVEVTDSKK